MVRSAMAGYLHLPSKKIFLREQKRFERKTNDYHKSFGIRNNFLFDALQDYATYWMHRIYHTPFLYKNFHKLHHKYKHPTAFSVTAIHPVESSSIQCVYALPLFLWPTHWCK